jgi:hypothetical protein
MPRLMTLEVLASSIQWTSGPGSMGSGRSTFLAGAEQTFSRVGDLLAFRAELSPKQRGSARREIGLLRALMLGENAVRVKIPNPHLRTMEEADGGSVTTRRWADGRLFSDGRAFDTGRPTAQLAGPHSAGASRILLNDGVWGPDLDLGDVIGFYGYFGAHWIVGVDEPKSYVISPPLRADLNSLRRCTLNPILCMSATPESITLQEGLISTEGQTVELVEILHEDAVAYYGGAYI